MFGKRRSKAEPDIGAQKLSCSFCKKTQDDVRKLIAGPTVFICDGCVQVCVSEQGLAGGVSLGAVAGVGAMPVVEGEEAIEAGLRRGTEVK